MLSMDSFGTSLCFWWLFVVKTEFKHLCKVIDKAIFDDAQLCFRAKQLFHRSHRLAFTGDNQVEVAEICIDVEREAMSGDPARDVDADRGNFPARSMHARQTFNTKRLDTKICQRANQDLFQIAYVAVYVFTVRAQADNWITDNLAQAVISHFSTTIRFKQRHVTLSQLILIEQNGGTVTAAADGKRVRMFEQEQRVRLGPVFDGLLGLFLQRESRLVVHEPQSLDQKLSFLHHATRLWTLCVILSAASVFGTIGRNKQRRNTLKPIAIAVLTAILIIPSSALGQTRRRTTPRQSAAAAAQKTAQVRTQGATRVAEQIKLLTRFTFVLGSVASGIAQVDEAVRRNEATPQMVENNQQSKARVKNSIQGFREGLDKLEIDFRATPELQPYYIKLAGVAAGAVKAEEQAAANQFEESGRSLLNVINRLTDVLLAMR